MTPAEKQALAILPTGANIVEWTAAPLVDMCAVAAPYGHLLGLTNDGALHGIDLDADTSVRLCTITLPDLGLADGNSHFGSPRHSLHASSDGRYAAVVVDFGRSGLVVDTLSGAITMTLDGGDYCNETVPFSVCFIRFDGRDVLVHRTDWNRLDVADPATGASITARSIEPYVSGGERPLHYLDYFHGRLRGSPGGSSLFDDGWVWHPISIPTAWSVTRWLTANPWESEDGDSLVNLARRDDWTQPACWIDEKRLVLWGAADWDEEAAEEVKRGPGVRLYDLSKSDHAKGPWWPMPGVADVLDLFSDGTCLFVATTSGTVAWEIATGAQVATWSGFAARLLDRSRKTLVAFGPGAIQELHLLG